MQLCKIIHSENLLQTIMQYHNQDIGVDAVWSSIKWDSEAHRPREDEVSWFTWCAQKNEHLEGVSCFFHLSGVGRVLGAYITDLCLLQPEWLITTHLCRLG